MVGWSDRVLCLIDKSPFAIVLISLMGGIPAVLLAIIFKGVFHVVGKDDDVISKNDLEACKEIIAVCKSMTP